jgi:hypothetical protein
MEDSFKVTSPYLVRPQYPTEEFYMPEDHVYLSKVMITECQQFKAIKIGAIELKYSTDLPPGVKNQPSDAKPFTQSLSLFSQE